MNRVFARTVINRVLSPLGLKVVNAGWGPRGFAASFCKLASMGIRPKNILDIGAANGVWTEECLAIFPDAHYALIDPLQENVTALASLASRNRNVRYLLTAVGAQRGTLHLHVHGDQSSFLSSEYDASAHLRAIPVTTIDALLQQGSLEAPDIIKADVQGFELEVLKGAQAALKNAEFVLLEVSFRAIYAGCPLAHDVIAAMAQYGFRIYDVCSYAQRPHDGELAQADILFARIGSRVFSHEGYF